VIATLGAIAWHRPEVIEGCVRPDEHGTYEVRLHETRYVPEQGRSEPTGRMVTLTVTPDLPMRDGRLDQGSTARDRAEILTQVTGEPAINRTFPKAMPEAGLAAESLLAAKFWHLLDDDKPILVGTRPRRPDEARLPHGLIDSHAYEVVAVTDVNMIQVRNPWNRRHPELMTPKQFRDNFRPYYTTLE